MFVDQHLRSGKPLFRFDEYNARIVRSGSEIKLAIMQSHGIEKVAVHWTTDTKGQWSKRKWETRAAQRMVGNATDFYSVDLPKDRPVIYFLTAIDNRGAVVSTEHAVIEK